MPFVWPLVCADWGMAADGANESAYTGPECPISRRDEEAWKSAGSVGDVSG